MDLVFAKFNLVAKASMLSILLAGGFCLPGALAAKKSLEPATKSGLSELKVALRLPQTASSIAIEVTNADFRLVHEDRNDIEVRTNYTKHWRVDDAGSVKQIDFAKCAFGVYHTQNGNNLIGTGTVPGSSANINMTPDGIFINGKRLPVEKRVTRVGSMGMEMNPDGLFINGHRVLNGSADPKSAKELDVLQIAVPRDFHGSLNIKSSSSLSGRVDSWDGDAFTLSNSGGGEYSLGSLKAKCALSVDQKGRLEVADIEGTVSVTAQDSGKARIKHFVCDNSSINSSGQSEVTVETASSQGLTVNASAKSTVVLGGNFSAETIKGDNIDLTASDSSKVVLQQADVEDCTVKTIGTGKIEVSGAFYCIEEPTGSAGGIKIKMEPREKTAR